MKTKDERKKELLKQKLLISESETEAYTKEHHLYFQKLPNEAVIFLAQRKVEDARNASVDISIRSGAYFDPPGQEGAHHFFEHLFFSKHIKEVYRKHLINNNGFTSYRKVTFVNAGIYNPAFSFGLPTALPETVKALKTASGFDDMQEFESTKQVILREIDESEGSAKKLISSAFNRYVFAPENPLNCHPLGKKESVKNMTLSQVKKLFEEASISSHLVIEGMAAGEGKEAEVLFKTIVDLFSEYPRIGKKKKLDLNLLSRFNTIPDEVGTVKTAIKNKLVCNYVFWKIPLEWYSPAYFSFSFFFHFLREKFFDRARTAGLGYSVDAFSMYLYPSTGMLGFYAVGPPQEKEKLMDKLLDVLKGLFDEFLENRSALEELIEIEKKRQEALPISQDARLNFGLSMYLTFGLLGNSDTVRKIDLNFDTKLLQEILKEIISKDPVKVMIGDL